LSAVTCWMCQSTIEPDSIASNSGPPTIRVPSSLPRKRHRPIGLSETPFPDDENPELPQAEHFKVCVVEGPSQGGEFEITSSITTIGRMGGGANVEIDDPEISRSHCAIEIRHDGILLYDLRSTNGTYLHNSRVSVVRLDIMSIFRIGTSLLQLKTTQRCVI
jgi:Inner membrane component of T3SS, cytoplasmic domain